MNLQTITTAARRIFGVSCPVCNSELVKPDGVKLYAKIGGSFMVLKYCPKKDYIQMLAMNLHGSKLTLTGEDAALEIRLRVGTGDAERVQCSFCENTNIDGRYIYICKECNKGCCSDCSVNLSGGVLCDVCAKQAGHA